MAPVNVEISINLDKSQAFVKNIRIILVYNVKHYYLVLWCSGMCSQIYQEEYCNRMENIRVCLVP
jgi:hypothetical protein